MTATTVPVRRGPAPWRALDDDTRQLIAVLATAVVAVVLGWLVVTATSGGTRAVEASGIRVSVPDGWIVRPGVGDVLIVAADPRRPAVRMSISRPDASAGSPTQVADRRLAARAGLLTAFSVLDRTQEQLDGKPVESVMFTWAAQPEGRPVLSMQGRDLVTGDPGAVLVATLESPSDGFEEALTAFEPFVASIEEVAP